MMISRSTSSIFEKDKNDMHKILKSLGGSLGQSVALVIVNHSVKKILLLRAKCIDPYPILLIQTRFNFIFLSAHSQHMLTCYGEMLFNFLIFQVEKANFSPSTLIHRSKAAFLTR